MKKRTAITIGMVILMIMVTLTGCKMNPYSGTESIEDIIPAEPETETDQEKNTEEETETTTTFPFADFKDKTFEYSGGENAGLGATSVHTFTLSTDGTDWYITVNPDDDPVKVSFTQSGENWMLEGYTVTMQDTVMTLTLNSDTCMYTVVS